MGWVVFFLFVFALAVGGCSPEPQMVQEHPVTQMASALKPGVYAIDKVDVRPVATKEVEPDFPPELGSILTGRAMVGFTVTTDGKVADPQVLQADDVLFGEAALHAAVKWRFHPALVHGQPVACRISLPFIFTS